MTTTAENNGSLIRFLRLPEVVALTGVSAVTIYRWQKKGEFPMRSKLGPHLIGWPEPKVIEWCQRHDRAIGDNTVTADDNQRGSL
tara:strand:- start:3939 stop:4193 length:255 start_codon:yes stop_codon:yes gene_type:complete